MRNLLLALSLSCASGVAAAHDISITHADREFHRPGHGRRGATVCLTTNFRGAEYIARGHGRRNACRKALRRCRRDSYAPRSCYVADWWTVRRGGGRGHGHGHGHGHRDGGIFRL